MLPSRVESDDGYVPAGLVNCTENTLESNTIKGNEIHEFYTLNETDSPVIIDKPANESGTFVDLLAKNNKEVPSPPSFSTPSTSSRAPKRSIQSTPRVLTIQPGSHLPLLPTDNPRPPLPRSFHPRGVLPPALRQTMYRPIAVPVPMSTLYQYGGRQMITSQRLPMPFHPPGRMPMKPQPATIAQQQAMMNPNMYGSPFNTPIPQMAYPPAVMVVHQPVPYYQPAPAPVAPPPSSQAPIEPIMPSPEVKPKITPETRKKLREEATAKLKAERDARKAVARAKKQAEKARTMAIKKKQDAAVEEGNLRKFGNFSKDMFVIRLKDLDSFSRSNEIWRIDNHVLIQKFTGVPSLKAPARQFQSTNRMSGYDSRATWRLFIINPDCVEIEKYGSEITIHNFPNITTLRDAKKLAEMKDEAFKEIEKSEFQEKLHKYEEKQQTKIEEKTRKRLEKKQKKLKQKLLNNSSDSKNPVTAADDFHAWDDANDTPSSSLNIPKFQNDEYVCQDVLNGLLDAVDDDDHDEDDSYISSDGDISASDEDEDDTDDDRDDEDAGSLISMAHSTDEEEREELVCNDAMYQLYGEDEIPVVAMEIVID